MGISVLPPKGGPYKSGSLPDWACLSGSLFFTSSTPARQQWAPLAEREVALGATAVLGVTFPGLEAFVCFRDHSWLIFHYYGQKVSATCSPTNLKHHFYPSQAAT